MVRQRALIVIFSTLLLIAWAGCDPKLSGPDGGTDPDTDPVPQTVATEAIRVGSVITAHAQLVSGGLAVAASYDTASTGDPFRGLFTTDCVSFELIDSQLPIHRMRLTDCVDANGTSYHGEFDVTPPIDAGDDGYLLIPDGTPEHVFSAANTENTDLQHTWNAGSFEYEFQRVGGQVTSVAVTNFMRHYLGSDVVSFNYNSVSYDGTIGNHGDWPASGSAINVAWDGVGIFEVTFNGGASASYRIRGVDYRCDLNDASVTIVTP